jgi:hypothetical protein
VGKKATPQTDEKLPTQRSSKVGGEINDIVEIVDSNDEYDKLEDLEQGVLTHRCLNKKTCGTSAPHVFQEVPTNLARRSS